MRLPIPADWSFKRLDVADAFDAHVREQLPWYDLATGAMVHVARHYIPHGGTVYDIGASTGNVGRALEPVLSARGARLLALDDSEQMRSVYSGPGEFVVADAVTHDYEPFDVAVAFLTFMFIKPAQRRTLVAKLRERVKFGGAIIIFDKAPLATGYAGTIMWRLALAGKIAQGVDAESVIAKELSLAGVQRPVSAYLFGSAVEFFRFGDFAGWLIEAGG